MTTTALDSKKVSEITIGELKDILRETINQLIDTDYGLDLKPEAKESLKRSVKSKERIPVQKVASELNLKW